MAVPQPRIVGCKEWGAQKPKSRIVVVGKPDKILIHHTAGHAALPQTGSKGLFNQGRDYALMLQHDMQGRRGWLDSGQSYLVMRSGLILEGRHGTTAAIKAGRMVESAHCPGENGEPGIEHEHVSGEKMTPEQWDASIALQAWICSCTGIKPTRLFGHRDFYGTDCPDNLELQINAMRLAVAKAITQQGRAKPKKLARLRAGYGVHRAVAS